MSPGSLRFGNAVSAAGADVMLDRVRQDFRFAYRGLWRAKAFSAAAVLTLALGIAGTTGMFALVEGVLLRPLPVHEQDRLIVAWKEVRTSGSARYPFGNTESNRSPRPVNFSRELLASRGMGSDAPF